MNLKKIVLYILLGFSIVSLGIIVFFAKSKNGFFAKEYAAYITNRITELGGGINKNLTDMAVTSKTLAEGALPKSVFESIANGESAEKYVVDFERVLSGIPFSKKIQIIDTTGDVVFSTVPGEIRTIRVKDTVLSRFMEHFAESRDPYIYFLNSDEALAVAPYVEQPQNVIDGFTLIYYDNKALLQGVESENLKIPFSVDQYMILAKSDKIDSQEIDKIVSYMTEPRHEPYNGKDQTIAMASANLGGVKVVLYTRDIKYIPWIAIAFVLVNLILMGLVIFVLLQTDKDEKEKEDYFLPKSSAGYGDEDKPYTTHAVSPDLAHEIEEEEYTAVHMTPQAHEFDRFEPEEEFQPVSPIDHEQFEQIETPPEEELTVPDLGVPEEEPAMPEFPSGFGEEETARPFQAPDQDEIRELVEDIDSGKEFNSDTAHKGIEEMIMSEDTSLLDMPLSQEEEPASGLPEEPFAPEASLEALDFGTMEDGGVPAQPAEIETGDTAGTAEVDFELPEEPAVGDAIFEPSDETKLFAEHDRIMGGIDDSDVAKSEADETAFDLDLELPELESAEPASEMAFPEEPGLDMTEIPETELTGIELPAEETLESESPVAEMNLGAEALEPELAAIENEVVQVGGEESGEPEVAETPADFDLDAMMAGISSGAHDEADGEDEPITLAPDEMAAITSDLDEIGEEPEVPVSGGVEPADLDLSEIPLGVDEPPLEGEPGPFEATEEEIEPEPEPANIDGIELMEEPDMDALPVDIEEAPEELIDLDTLETPFAAPEIDFDETPADIEDIPVETAHAEEEEAKPVDLDIDTLSKMADMDEGTVPAPAEPETHETDSGMVEIDAGELGGGDFAEPMDEDLAVPDVAEFSPDFDLDSMMNSISGGEAGADDDDDSISLDASQLAAIEVDEPAAAAPEPAAAAPEPEEGSTQGAIDFAKLFSEPPTKISTIGDVDSYADVAMDLAKNNLKIQKVNILKRTPTGFETSVNEGFEGPIKITTDDPLFKKFISNKKSVDIRGDLAGAKYLQSILSANDLGNLEELIIVPIVKVDSVEGIAVYGREKGVNEPTSFQKSELHNLGFLQQD